MARRTVTAPREADSGINEVYEEGPTGEPRYVVARNHRDEYWWQAGPIDSCCWLFSLETGIVILAGLKAVHYGMTLLTFMLSIASVKFIGAEVQKGIEDFLPQARDAYTSLCVTVDNPTTLSEKECQQLEQMIQRLQDSTHWAWDQVHEYLIMFSLTVGLASGLTGLWAACGPNTFAAKLFLLSWPATFALEIMQWIVGKFTIEQQLYHYISMGKSSSTISKNSLNDCAIIYAVYCFFLAYFTKVSWSYYEVIRIRGGRTTGDVELREISDDSNATLILYAPGLSS